jgi:hypothetical protein
MAEKTAEYKKDERTGIFTDSDGNTVDPYAYNPRHKNGKEVMTEEDAVLAAAQGNAPSTMNTAADLAAGKGKPDTTKDAAGAAKDAK